jgi:hypothetical protein
LNQSTRTYPDFALQTAVKVHHLTCVSGYVHKSKSSSGWFLIWNLWKLPPAQTLGTALAGATAKAKAHGLWLISRTACGRALRRTPRHHRSTSLGWQRWCCQRLFRAIFPTKKDEFTKTGSGQTQGQFEAKNAFSFLQAKGKHGGFALKGGNAQGGALQTLHDGPRPPGYEIMKKQGSIILGETASAADQRQGTKAQRQAGRLDLTWPDLNWPELNWPELTCQCMQVSAATTAAGLSALSSELFLLPLNHFVSR